MEIRVWRGDLTILAVDAIVNAANEGLRRGGGVCGAIFAAAGPRLDDACDTIGHCATGDAVITPGFDLPADFVVHTVGPVWQGGIDDESDRLASCYRRSVEVAAAAGVRSIAFPAISTGIYGYPADAAAEVAVSTLRSLVDASAEGPLDEVVLVAFDAATEDRYRSLLADQ